ncbi:MAG: serine hydrolase domain-containing protein, partial [Gemmatimonadaceae bacterium]
MRLGFIILIAMVAGCTGADARSGADSAVAWTPAPPAKLADRLDSARLAVAFERAADLPRLRSLIVQWRGQVVGEEYFNGARPTTRANIKSASKSIVSALVGIAIAQGELRGVDQPISELLVAETRGLDSAKRAITVGDLLSMRAGLQSTSFGNYGAWVTSRNWVRYALQRPMVAPAGDAGPMIYSTGSSHLLSAILTRTSRVSTWEYANRHLARPLAIALPQWQRDPQGVYFGGNDMYMTPRAMVAFGNLYLRRGKTADGKQVVPAAWVDSSWVVRTRSDWSGMEYGYGWWARPMAGHDVRLAWGYGGQFIFVVPSLDLVVWKLGGRDEQYAPDNTGLKPSPASKEQVDERRGWKETVDKETAVRRT